MAKTAQSPERHPAPGEEGFRQYVAGFLFLDGKVLLVRKTHPKWQAGMMNAVGGEIEPGEQAHAAMRREFHEEANYDTDGWNMFCLENGPGYRVWFYRYFADNPAMSTYRAPAKNDRGEELEWCDPRNQKYPQIGNLNWLLPMALDPRPLEVIVHTRGDIRRIVTW